MGARGLGGGGHFVIRRDFMGSLYMGFLGSLRFQFESLLLGVALSGFQVYRGGSQGSPGEVRWRFMGVVILINNWERLLYLLLFLSLVVRFIWMSDFPARETCLRSFDFHLYRKYRFDRSAVQKSHSFSFILFFYIWLKELFLYFTLLTSLNAFGSIIIR